MPLLFILALGCLLAIGSGFIDKINNNVDHDILRDNSNRITVIEHNVASSTRANQEFQQSVRSFMIKRK